MYAFQCIDEAVAIMEKLKDTTYASHQAEQMSSCARTWAEIAKAKVALAEADRKGWSV